MALNVIYNNIAVVFADNISDSLKTDPIELILAEVYSEKNPKPIVSKFPGQTIIFVPEVQNSVIFESNKFLVSDQTIGDFSKKDLKSFIAITDRIRNSFDKKSIAHGFNFIYEFEGKSFSTLAKKLHKKFYKDSIDLPKDSKLDFVLPYITLTKEEQKITVKFEAVRDSKNRELNRIRISVNAHSDSMLPALKELHDNYQKTNKFLEEYVNGVFSK